MTHCTRNHVVSQATNVLFEARQTLKAGDRQTLGHEEHLRLDNPIARMYGYVKGKWGHHFLHRTAALDVVRASVAWNGVERKEGRAKEQLQ